MRARFRSRLRFAGALALTAIVVAAALAGCASPQTAPAAEAPDPGHSAGSAANETVTLHLARDMLVTAAPAGPTPERVAVPSFPRTWGKTEGLPTFRSGPLPDGLRILGGNVTLYAEPRGVAASTLRFVEWIAYVGSDGFPNVAGVTRAEAVHAAGEVREIRIPLTAPRGGSVVLPGERLALIVFPVQTQEDAAEPTTLDLLVNATVTDARVVLEVAPWDGAPVAEGPARAFAGTLAASAYAGAQEGLNRATHPFEVPEGAAGLVARLVDASGAPFADLDLDVAAPDGTPVASSGTPYSREGVRVAGPAFTAHGPGAWTVGVTAYGSAVAEYRAEVHPLLPRE